MGCWVLSFPQIISCSRRAGVPAFFAPWLLSRPRAGFCHAKNPHWPKVRRVSLPPVRVAGQAAFASSWPVVGPPG
jgi:hypothetical protein